MNTTANLLSGILALLLPISVFADPKPAPPSQRILVTLQVVEVPSTIPISVSGTHPASELYKTLLQAPGAEATEISVVTPADFPGSAQYSRVLAFTAQDHGVPSLGVVTAPTALAATPHVNLNGTITVHLNMEVTSLVPSAASITAGAVPNTTSQQMTTTHTFTSGETVLLGRALHTSPTGNISGGNEVKEWLEFVTVQILPDEKTAAR